MGLQVQLHQCREPAVSLKMLQIIVLLGAFASAMSMPEPGYGYHGYHHPPPCVKEHETIKVSACKLVPEKTCATETVKIGEKITGVKKEVCKSVPVKADVNKDVETCTEVAKEVCEEVEKIVPKVTCKTATIKH